MANIQHGIDGWELVEMDWSSEDGSALFIYERIVPGVGLEVAEVMRAQPSTFRHDGWWERDRTVRVFEFTELDRFKFERGHYNEEVEFDRWARY